MTEEHGPALKRMADLMEGRDPPTFAPDRIEIYKFLQEKAGIALVPKIVAILEYVYRRAERGMLIRLIVRAARGGGKTYSLSIGVEFALWWFFGYDFVNFGGSKSQAQKAYAAITKMMDLEEVSPYVKKSLMSETVHENGNWISVIAASERQTRGGHPGSVNNGGGLFIDEECMPPGELVHVESGVKEIEKLTDLDRVYGMNGKLQSIVTTTSRDYDGDIVRIIPVYNTGGFRCTPKHPVLCVRKGCSNPEWVCAGDLRVGDFTIRPIGNNMGVGDYDREWLIGFYIAEGSANNHGKIYFSIHLNEKEYLARIRKFFLDVRGRNASVYRQKKGLCNCVNVQIYDPDFSSYLIEMCGRRAENKRFPFLSDAIVRGYLDGDGMMINRGENTYQVPGVRVRVHTTSKHIVHQLQRYYTNAHDFGRAGVYPQKHGKKWQLELNDGPQKHGWFDSGYQYSGIRKIERKRYVGKVFNIQTRDNTYYVAGGIIHNCEVQSRKLVDSVKPVVNTAHPSLIMRASTQHKSGQGGGDETFEECWDKAKEQNYERFEWDIFDVCQHCTKKCGVSIEDDPVDGCVDAFRKGYVDSDGNWQDGYCLGRAHHDGLKWREDKDGNWNSEYIEDWDWVKFSEKMGFGFKVEGWIAIDEIFQDWTETDRRTFEIEYLGRKMERKGRVYDPEMIDNAIEDGNRIITEVSRDAFMRTDMKAVGGDWGWSNQTCMVYTFQWRRTVCVYWVDYFRRDRIGVIVSAVNGRADEDGIEDAYCDSEGAFENQELGQKMLVKSVAFSVWKDYGVANMRNLMEKRRFAIVNGLFGRKCPGMKTFIEQMKDYRYDENGNYIKKNDHGPDAAMCALLKWARARITHGSKGKRLRKSPRLAVIKG